MSLPIDEDETVLVAGGLLADPDFLLQKLADDGGLSVWRGRPTDADPVQAAAAALPLRNGSIRRTTVGRLRSAGFVVMPTAGPDFAADPDRHCDATVDDVTMEAIVSFISAFDQPIKNPSKP